MLCVAVETDRLLQLNQELGSWFMMHAFNNHCHVSQLSRCWKGGLTTDDQMWIMSGGSVVAFSLSLPLLFLPSFLSPPLPPLSPSSGYFAQEAKDGSSGNSSKSWLLSPLVHLTMASPLTLSRLTSHIISLMTTGLIKRITSLAIYFAPTIVYTSPHFQLVIEHSSPITIKLSVCHVITM